MTEKLKQRLQKISELIERGATDGERAAAKAAFDRLVKAHNIDVSDIDTLKVSKRFFSYSTFLDTALFVRIWDIILNRTDIVDKYVGREKKLAVMANHEEWVLLDCAYGYFRKHMKAQYAKVVLPELKKKRKAKTKAKRRGELTIRFFTHYCIKSDLVRPEEIQTKKVTDPKEWEDIEKMEGVEGGSFKKQMTGTNLLEY